MSEHLYRWISQSVWPCSFIIQDNKDFYKNRAFTTHRLGSCDPDSLKTSLPAPTTCCATAASYESTPPPSVCAAPVARRSSSATGSNPRGTSTPRVAAAEWCPRQNKYFYLSTKTMIKNQKWFFCVVTCLLMRFYWE